MRDISALDIAIEYIEHNLNKAIGLQDVAGAAGYSYYHMTRLFAAVFGESVGSYINKRRLYNASRELLYSRRKIIDIALDSGFESSEAFSRAFKKLSGASPSQYRKNKLDLVTITKRKLTGEQRRHVAGNITLQPELVELKPARIAGIRGATTLTDNALPVLWRRYMQLCRTYCRTGAVGYSVCETEKAVYSEDGDMQFSVMIGSPADCFSYLPEIAEEKCLSGGNYAVFQHRGSLAGLARSYEYIFGTWAMSSGCRLDTREDFELYNGAVLPYDSPDNLVRIYIPVV